MKKRRMVVSLVAALVLAGAFSVTVLAGGAGHGKEHNGKYTRCAVDSCTQASFHTHDGVTYAPHHTEDGHGYHAQTPAGGHSGGGHH